jgi:hypothetical protein
MLAQDPVQPVLVVAVMELSALKQVVLAVFTSLVPGIPVALHPALRGLAAAGEVQAVRGVGSRKGPERVTASLARRLPIQLVQQDAPIRGRSLLVLLIQVMGVAAQLAPRETWGVPAS